MTTRKAIADLSELSPTRKDQLCDWLLSGLSFEKVRQLAEKEWGVQSASDGSLEIFWREYCAPALLSRRNRAAEMSNLIVAEAVKSDVRFEKAALETLKQKTFELMLTPQLDPTLLRQVIGFVLKIRDQELSERRLDLMEKRLELAKQVDETVNDDALSDEQRQERLKEIFGL